LSARPCPRGRADHGSQLQIQIYVNRRPHELSERVLDALPSLASLNPRLRWVSPLEKDDFAEYGDEAFLAAVGLQKLAGNLVGKFWPRRGPCWDALAVVEIGGEPVRRGVVLVEAKSYREEMYSKGCQALPPSRQRIEAALEKTKRWLGVPKDVDWTGPLYQSANRLAHLYFFLEAGVPAWLVNVYFLCDPHCPPPYPPMSRGEWRVALVEDKTKLGLAGVAVPYTADLFLEGKDRSELAGPTDGETGTG